MRSGRAGSRCSVGRPLKRLSLRQSLALWTLVPMVTFSVIVFLLSFGWAWRNVQEVTDEHSASLAYVTAAALQARMAQQGDRVVVSCAALGDLSRRSTKTWYIVDREGQIRCAQGSARLPVGGQIDHDLQGDGAGDSSRGVFHLREGGYSVSYAPIPGTSWIVVLEEARSALLGTTYSRTSLSSDWTSRQTRLRSLSTRLSLRYAQTSFAGLRTSSSM